jgi:hypothetical protein
VNLVTAINIDDIKIEYMRAAKKADKEISKLGSRDASNLISRIQNVLADKSEQSFLVLSNEVDALIRRHVRYKKIVEYIKANDPCGFRRLIDDISGAYDSGTYILSNGDLEDYLGIESKGLEAIYQFCTTGMDSWLTSDSFQEERSEILGILEAFADF